MRVYTCYQLLFSPVAAEDHDNKEREDQFLSSIRDGKVDHVQELVSGEQSLCLFVFVCLLLFIILIRIFTYIETSPLLVKGVQI